MYTITFNELRELGESPFPEYEFNTITVLDKQITKEDFENLFYEYYGMYQIAYPTHTEFCFEFQRIFNRNYNKFLKQVEIANNIVYDLAGYKRNVTREYDDTSKNSDTPNESLQDGQLGDTYLTGVSRDTGNGETVEKYTTNDIEKFNAVQEKINDVMYNFLEKFNDCFLTYKTTKTYYKWRWQLWTR